MLTQIFEEQVNKFPNKIAVKTSEKVLSYTDLNKYANKVAYKIVAEHLENISSNVALLFGHGIDMVIGTIAAIKSGRTYVPLDNSYPQNRLRYMIENSDVKVLITNNENYKLAESIIDGLVDIQIINITSIGDDVPNNNLDININGDSIAYILYTSGSTGLPKGVMQSYENMYYFIENYIKDLGITHEDRMTLFSAFSHDAAIMDIYGALLSGASLYPLNVRNQINASELTNWLIDEEITIWHSVPTLFRYYTNILSGEEIFKKLKFIVLGGEATLNHDIDMFQQYFKYSTLVNLYGQSEASYNSSLFIENSNELDEITLGNIVGETELLLVDKDGEEVDILRTGEIIVACKHIALGYWRDKAATDKVFMENPGLGRFYRTGDLGKLLPDGSIQFMGRKDYQINIRGYRVELGDIESQLLKITEVKEAVVIGKTGEQEETFLHAYIVADKKFTVGELREFLGKELPDYMIPSYFIQIDEMPLTPNGKIDRKALYDINLFLSDEGMQTGVEYEASRNEIEQKLVEIWREVLRVEKIGINDNFFEIGGHSLKATSLISKIHKMLNVEVPLKEIFANPTIKGISEYIKGTNESKYIAIEAAEEREYYELSSAQKRLYTLHQLETDGISYNMPSIIAIEGRLDKVRLEEAFRKLIQRHEALRTSFHMDNEEIVQKIHSELPFEIEYKEAKEGQTSDIVKSFVRAFDLRKAPLLRVGLIKINEERHILMYDIHHIISDGVSMTILLQEFISFYEGKELPKLRLQYKDYAVWQNRKESLETLEKQGQYWTEILKDCDQPLTMPLDYQREAIQTFAGDTINFNIDSRIVQKLNTLVQKEKTTINTVLISAYSMLLSKYCNQKDITVGVTVANRPNLELENVIGAFINFLPIRSRVNEDMSFLEFMRQQKNIIAEAYNNQEYPFDEMVKNSPIRIDNNRNPLFDTMLIYHNELNFNTTINIEGLSFSKVEFNKQTSKLDFKFDVFPSKDGSLNFYLEYNTGLYKRESMERFGEQYGLLLEKCIGNSGLNMSDIDIFTETEKISIKEKREAINKDISITKLAVAATFTAEPIEEYVKWWCEKHKHKVEHSFAQYNQVFQELLDENSIISRNNGINLLMVRFEDWIRDINANDEYKLELLEANYNRLTELLRNKNKHCLYIVGIFPVSDQLGLSSRLVEYINNMNQRWQSEVKSLEGVDVLDFSDVSEQYGIKEIFDPVKDKVGHMPFSDEYYAAIAAAIARHICAVKASPFKVIAVDCDNTLWKGICGEDGAMGVKVLEPYIELQKLLIKKHDEGMLLALCSKNNEGDVWEVFEKNTQMLLKKEHLVGWKLNWRPKSDNLKELAEELNLGIDSFIFIDDNPMECYDMMKNNPKVLTLQLPEEPQQIPMYLKHVWAFDKLKVTAEDRMRTKSYQLERERKELQKSSFTLEDFLQEIKPKVYINEIDKEQIPRVSQLTQRTNQFNLSTKRRLEEDIEMLMHNPKVKCWTVEVEDRFGEYGLTGVLIIENQDDKLLIDTFLLSCRVLGRGIENAIMTALKKHCQQNGINIVEADFYPTAKNHPIKSFIEKAGWSKTDETAEYIRYILSTQDLPDSIKHIECIYEKPNKASNKPIESNKLECSLDHIGIAVNSIDAMEEYYKSMSFVNTAATFDPLQNASLVMLKKDGLDSIELVYMSDIERRTYISDGNKVGKPYHLCYRVKNFSEVLKELDNNNIPWEIVSQAKQAVLFGGKEVMFIHVQGVGVIEFLQDNNLDNGVKVENVIRLKTTDYENCITFFKVLGYLETNRIYNEARKIMSIVMSKQGTGNIELLADMGSELSQQRTGVQQICYKCDSSEIKNYLNNDISKNVISSYKYGSLSKANIILQSDEAQYNLFYSVPETVKNTTEMKWQITIENEAELLHNAYMLPLKYYTGEKLLQMPIYENMKAGRKSNNYEAPRNPLEEKLVKIFEEILRIEKVGINNSFFDLGGHSLRATSLIGRLHKELNIEVPLREIFRTPTIKGLVEYIKLSGKNQYEEIEKVEDKEYYEMSSAQKRMYTLQQLELNSTIYNMPGVLELEGDVNKDRLKEAFDKLIQRHEALRTSFESLEEGLIQKVHSKVEFNIEEYKVEDDKAIEETVKGFIRTFDLSKAPLLRVGIIKIQSNKHILIYDMHHIISDGVSMGILVEEFSKAYAGEELTPLRIQYKDFSEWQNELFNSDKMKTQEEYWLKQFEGEIPVLNLTTDYQRPAIQSFEGDTIQFKLEKELTNKLRQITKATGSTMYMVLLSTLNILLSKYSGQEDIVVGSPIAGRPHADLRNIIGMFVNTLAMRNYPIGEKTFKEFLNEVKENALGAYANQDYQFEELVEKLNVSRDFSRNPVFDVMLVLQNMDKVAIKLEGLNISTYKTENKISKFDITVIAVEMRDNISISMQYCTKLFNKVTIKRMYGHLENIIEAVVKNLDVKLSEIEVLAEEEKQQILVDFNNTRVDYSKGKTIHKMFEEQVERTPDNMAAVYGEKSLTYRELNEKANQLAGVLRNKVVSADSIVCDSIVAIVMEKSPEMLICMLGILKAGAAYLPIDPDYPSDRIKYMLDDSKAEIVVTSHSIGDAIEVYRDILYIEDVLNHVNSYDNIETSKNGESLAYVIYTSGSTGNPKGVMVEHRAIVNTLQWYISNYGLCETDVALQTTSFSFDSSVEDIFSILLTGGKLLLLNNEERTKVEYLRKKIQEEKVTRFLTVPSFYTLLISEETDCLQGLRYVTIGGEACTNKMLEQHFSKLTNTRLFNEYGPTENSVTSTIFEIKNSMADVFIGKPIANTKCYIVDKHNSLLPVGISGELCVSGEGLARGYLYRPELTSEKFINNPYEVETRMYRTGDMARWLPDGNIELLGRIDHQVKIRGYRIELGEIETKLLSHATVEDAAVIAKDDSNGNKYICAYVVGDKELTVTKLRSHLSEILPDYMIPSHFVRLEKLPLTPNGKVDRTALAKNTLTEGNESLTTGIEYETPRNVTEDILLKIWQEVLEVERFGINDNFFELGGHSIKATSLTSKIHKQLNVEIPLKEIFKAPTIKGISEYILHSEKSIYTMIEPTEEQEYYEMSSSQKRMYILNQLDKESTSYNMTNILVIENELDLQKFTEVFYKIIERHEALRTSFESIEGALVQKVYKKIDFKVQYIELDNEDQVEEEVKNFIKSFNLSKPPLLRVGLIKIHSNKYILIYDMHHIISDGVSMGILIKEFGTLYQGIELPKLKIQYKDYTEWQRKPYYVEKLEAQEKYWINTFNDEIQPLSMPLDYDSKNWRRFDGAVIKFKVNNEIVQQLKELATRENTTLNTLLLSLYSILLSKYSQQNEIIVGSIVANRNHADLENVVGNFINFLPIKSIINPYTKVIEYIQYYKMLLQDVYNNQEYPFDKIVQNCRSAAANSRNPIFDTMLIFHNEIDANQDLNIGSLHMSPYAWKKDTSTLDFKLDAALNNKNELACSIQYNNSLYKADSIQGLAKHFELILATALANLESNIIDIEVFSEAEKQNIEAKRKAFIAINTSTNIVISSTFTAEPLKEQLSWWCEKLNKKAKISFAPYNQVFQELMDINSLTSQNTGLNLIMVRFEDWIRDNKSKDIEKCNLIRNNFERLIDILKNKEKTAKYIVCIFPVSNHLGLSTEVIDYIKELNNEWHNTVKNIEDVGLLDCTNLAKLYNIRVIFNPITDKVGHMPFSDEYYAALGTVIARKFSAFKSNPFKVIAVDCDNTLWKGIVGEDGALGVAIEEPYLELQKLLIQKYNEGILIVLSSKNNEADVWEVFDNNPHMLLKKEHLASWKINWESKYKGLRDLAKELNLGIDSFIFIDDNSKECYEMMANNPQVLTLQLPKEPKQIPMFLKHVWAFDKENITEEDKLRTKRYQIERQRQEIQRESSRLEDFLKELNLKIYINEIKEEDIARVAQLTQRTNQFNLSTIRRTEAEIENITKNSESKCWSIKVEDRFGEYGLTGVVIIEIRNETAFIDTFLLSCRVLGRQVEDAILVELCKYCKENDITKLEADFYPTKKNQPFEEYLRRTNWQQVLESEKYIKYELLVESVDNTIDSIECHFNEEQYKAPNCDDTNNVITEVAASVEVKDAQQEYKLTVESNWQVNINNEEELLHISLLMPLKYCTGKKLLEIPKSKQQYTNSHIYEAPRSNIEVELVNIWSAVLGAEVVGINDNFFELGGDSLKATSLVAKIHKALNVEVPLSEIFTNPTIKGISEYINNSEESIYSSIELVAEQDYYKMSSAQKRIYTLQQLEPNGTSYNIPGVLVLEGKLNINRLKEVFNKLIKRHEAFRTSFEIIDEVLVQKVHKEVIFEIACYEAESEMEIDTLVKSFIRAFNLSKAPLLKVGVIKVQKDKHILMYDMHHIISDGTSIGILIKEFSKLYAGENLSPLRVQYKDFSEWQNKLFIGEGIKLQEEYWLEQLKGEIPVLNLPTDYQRPAVQSFEGDTIHFKVDMELTEKLRKLSKDTGTTMYMVLLSTFNVMLSKYSGQEDIIVGSPIAGRPHTDLENIIGMFVNTLAMRNYPIGEKYFKEFLKEVKENALNAYKNQDYQFEVLVDKLNVSRDLSRNPIFDVMFILQNINIDKITAEDLKISPYKSEDKISKFDITITAIEQRDSIDISIQYSTKLFNKSTMERMYKHLENIMQIVTGNTDIKLSNIEMLSEVEKRQLLLDFNNTKAEYLHIKTIHKLFEEQAEKNPDKVAVLQGEAILTYKQLNDKANQLAAVLQHRGVAPDSIVGMIVKRRPEMLVAMLGILKAGGAYLPIDPDYPADRIKYMLQDSNARLLLTSSGLENIVDCELDKLIIDEALNCENICFKPLTAANAINLAYIIYTSGSTGKPKGVMIEHNSIINFIKGITDIIDFNASSILCLTSITFDIMGLETLLPLTKGLKIVIADEETQKDQARISGIIEKEEITMLQATPSRIQMLMNGPEGITSLNKLNTIMVGGEALSEALLFELQKHTNAKIYNMYGHTETTIWSTVKELTTEQKITIGKPIANTQIYILDKNNMLQAVGIPGELCIAGHGLARGYLNRPELEDEKFVQNPFETGAMMYRTGDLARWLPNGDIEFLGRIDNQVKIRGYRIELGEIEKRLLLHHFVSEAVVIAKVDNSGVAYLCSYTVGEKELTGSELREHVSKTLPDYMIPSYFVKLDRIPLTPNGKVDRKSLPEPDANAVSGTEYQAPVSELEKKLAVIWQIVLGVEQIGINDNFFELGGHSLKAIKAVNMIKQQLNYDIGLKDIFQHGTIAALSKNIGDYNLINYAYISKAPEKEYYELSYNQKRLLILNRLNPEGTEYNISGNLKIKAKVNIEDVLKTFEFMMSRHESLRTSFGIIDGKYVQWLEEKLDFNVDFSDISSLADDEKEAEYKRIFRAKAKHVFDLGQAPLMVSEVVKLSEDEFELIYSIHHIISDGWSIGMLKKEFSIAYEALRNNKNPQLPELNLQYKDFAEWQNKQIEDSVQMNHAKDYWKKLLSEKADEMSLYMKSNHSEIPENSGSSYRIVIDEAVKQKLKEIALKHKTSLFSLMVSALYMYFAELTQQEEITFGTAGSGREHPGLENIFGYFVNVVVLRNKVDWSESYPDFLNRISKNILEALKYQDYPIELIAEELKIDYPAINVFVNMLNVYENENEQLLNTESRHVEEGQNIKFDMEFYLVEYANGLEILCTYARKFLIQQ